MFKPRHALKNKESLPDATPDASGVEYEVAPFQVIDDAVIADENVVII